MLSNVHVAVCDCPLTMKRSLSHQASILTFAKKAHSDVETDQSQCDEADCDLDSESEEETQIEKHTKQIRGDRTLEATNL